MQITESNFEALLQYFFDSDYIDLRNISFIDPYGMVGLLEFGEIFSARHIRKTLCLPASPEVLKYLERMNFFRLASRYFDLEPDAVPVTERYSRSAESDVLLEITPIERPEDIHRIVATVKDRAQAILAKHLHYDERGISGFIVALSEVCQNIIEHSETTGFVGIQKYHVQREKKNLVRIAVMDAGIGFRRSLAARFGYAEDVEAIENALFNEVSRYSDEGRGHGLAGVRRFVTRWNGRLSIRSGSAKISLIPGQTAGKIEKDLTEFPGSQIHIVLPEISGAA